jgi:hypothetical protein
MGMSLIVGLIVGLAAPHIYDPGITAAMPQIVMPQPTTTPFQNTTGYMQKDVMLKRDVLINFVPLKPQPLPMHQLVVISINGAIQDRGYTDNQSSVVFQMYPYEIYNVTFANCTRKIQPADFDYYRVWC